MILTDIRYKAGLVNRVIFRRPSISSPLGVTAVGWFDASDSAYMIETAFMRTVAVKNE